MKQFLTDTDTGIKGQALLEQNPKIWHHLWKKAVGRKWRSNKETITKGRKSNAKLLVKAGKEETIVVG